MHLSQLIKQKAYEKVVFRLRRHPFTFLPFIILFLFMCAVPFGVYFLITNLFPTIMEHFVVYPAAVLFGSVYLLSAYLFLYVQFLDFYLDVWVITNDRIVDMEQFGLFQRTTTELDLFRIQDVTATIHGVFPTLFNYGDLHIKTASINTDIVFRNIPDPNGVRERVIQLADEDRKFHYQESMAGV